MIKINNFSDAEINYSQRAKIDKPIIALCFMSFLAYFFAFCNGTLSQTACGVFILLAVQFILVSFKRELILNIFLLVGLSVLYFYYFWNGTLILENLPNFAGEGLIALIIISIFNKKQANSYSQLMVLASALMIYCAVFVWLPWLALLTAVFMALLCYCGYLNNILEGLRNNNVFLDNPRNNQETVFLKNTAIYSRIPTKRIAISAFIVGLLVFGAGAAAFMFTPRINPPDLPINLKNLLKDIPIKIDLNKAFPSQSFEVFMKVRAFNAQNNKPINLLGTPHAYIRSETLNSYADSCWTDTNIAETEVLANELTTRAAKFIQKNTDKLAIYQITSLYNSQNKLYTPYKTLFVNGSWKEDITRNARFEYQLYESFKSSENCNLDSKGMLVKYETISYLGSESRSTRNKIAKAFFPQKYNAYYRLKPKLASLKMDSHDRELIQALVIKWVGNLLRSRQEIARGTLSYRKKQKAISKINYEIAEILTNNLRINYKYTFTPGKSSPYRDGIVDFLFYTKTGHCQYFASALTAMCTIARIPARVVLGFHLSEYNEKDKCYIARGRDAHAWCEVYTKDKGWTLFEPTAPAERQAYLDNDAMANWIKKRLADMNFDWNSTSIKLANGLLSRKVGHFARNSLSGLHKLLRNINIDAPDVDINIDSSNSSERSTLPNLTLSQKLMKNLLWIVLGVILIATLIYIHFKYGFRKLIRRSAKQRFEHQIYLIEKLFALLRKYKFQRDPAKTLAELLHQAKADFNLPDDHIKFFIDLEYKTRWGKIPVSEEELHTAEQCYTVIRDKVLAYIEQQKHSKKGKIRPVTP